MSRFRLRPHVALAAGPFGALLPLLVLLVLLVKGVATADRSGAGTLQEFSGFVRVLAGTGLTIQAALVTHLTILRCALVAAAAAGALVLVRNRRGTLKRDLPILLGVLLLALSASCLPAAPAAALVLGVAGGTGLLLVPARESDGPPGSAVLLVLPFGIGILLRFFALEAIPEGYSQHAVVHHVSHSLPQADALSALVEAGRLREAAATAREWIVNEQFGLMSVLAAIGFKTVGVSFTISRAFSAATGTLAILCAYFCGKNLFDRRVGLVFSFLLAVCPWHIAASRYGDLEHVLATFQFLLALAFYAAAIRRGRTLDWILAGLAVGLSWFVYASNMVVPLIVALHLLLMLVFRRGFFRRMWWRVLLFAAVFAMLSASTLATMARDGILMPTVRTGYQDGKAIPVGQLERNIRMTGETLRELLLDVDDAWFLKPGGGLSLTEEILLAPGILLCLAGLFVPEVRWPSVLVLSGLPLSLLPGILGPDPSFRRVYPTAILALLLAAVVLVRGLDGLRALGVSPAARRGAGAALAVVLAAVNSHVIFDVAHVLADEDCRADTAVAREARKLIGTEFVYLYVPSTVAPDDLHRYIRFEAFEKLARLSTEGRSPADLYEVVAGRKLLDVLTAPRRISGRVRILAKTDRVQGQDDGLDVRETIRLRFPGAREEELRGSGPVPLVRTWQLP